MNLDAQRKRRAEGLAMYDAGASAEKVAKKFNLTKQVVYQWRTRRKHEQEEMNHVNTTARIARDSRRREAEAEAIRPHVAYLFGGIEQQIRSYCDSTALSFAALSRSVAELLLSKTSGALLGMPDHVSELPGNTSEASAVRKSEVEMAFNARGRLPAQQKARKARVREAVRQLSSNGHNQKTFGQMIRAARENYGWSLNTAARSKEGPYKGHHALTLLEEDKQKPTARSVRRFAKFYKLPLRELTAAIVEQ